MIVRFLQRYAGFFAILAGALTYSLILPKGSPWWMEFGVALPVTIGVYLLLYKYGATRHTTKR